VLAGAPQDAVAVLAIHRFQEDTQLSAIHLLTVLAGGAGPGEESGGGTVVRTLPAHAVSQGVVRQVACGVGGARAVVATATAHVARPRVQAAAARAVGVFSRGGLLPQVTLLDAGVVEMLVSAVYNFPQMPDVQVAAVSTLLTLAADSATNKQAVVKGGGKKAVDWSVRTHPTVDFSALLVGRVRRWARSRQEATKREGDCQHGNLISRFLNRFACFGLQPK